MSNDPPVFDEKRYIEKLNARVERRDDRVNAEIAAWEKRPQPDAELGAIVGVERVTALRGGLGLAIGVAVIGGVASLVLLEGSGAFAGVALAVSVAAMLLQVRTESRESWNDTVRERAKQMMRYALVRMSTSTPIAGRVGISLALESPLDFAAAYDLLGDHLRGKSAVGVEIVHDDAPRCDFSAPVGAVPIRV